MAAAMNGQVSAAYWEREWPKHAEPFRFGADGEDTTYALGMGFLDGLPLVEDWGCGGRWAQRFLTRGEYLGIDGTSTFADVNADLREYRSQADGIFMRHVLEHNDDWRLILANAVASFGSRFALIVFTPFRERTERMTDWDWVVPPVVNISFRREDLLEILTPFDVREEHVRTDTPCGGEHVFYVTRKAMT